MYFYYREILYKESSIVSFIKKHVWIDPSDRDYVNSLNKNDFILIVAQERHFVIKFLRVSYLSYLWEYS